MSHKTADVNKGALLALLAASQFVVVLDASITNVALPSIGRALDISQDGLSWVVNAYTLTFGGFLLLGGRLADLLGRRRVYMAGLIVFGIASFMGGLAQGEPMLIVSRALQGLGAALLSPAALSILTATFTEGAERNKALGVWGAVAGAGGAVGVLLGGILTEYLSWRWVLLVNVPIVAAAAVLAPRIIVESRVAARTQGFDVAGAVSVTAGVSLLVYALVDANNRGWGSPVTVEGLDGSHRVHGFSSRIRFENVTGPLSIHTFSGQVDIRNDTWGANQSVDIDTFSGSVDLHVPEDAAGTTSVSGDAGEVLTTTGTTAAGTGTRRRGTSSTPSPSTRCAARCASATRWPSSAPSGCGSSCTRATTWPRSAR